MGRMPATKRAVTAFFDERGAAQQAIDDLAAAGIGRDRITLVDGAAGPGAVTPEASGDRGLWSTVKSLFMADEDRHAYGEGLRRGGSLLSVETRGDDARVVEILDREGAVDMDARQTHWESEGWDPVRASRDLESLAASHADPRPASSADAAKAVVAPSVPVGPAFAATDAAGAARRPATVVRDPEAEGLRLRTYVASRDPAGTPR